MRERPILFSGPMVRAILDGTKTQTRRAVKGIDPENLEETISASQWQRVNREKPVSFGATYFCPYGQVGDRLWVRETWAYEIHALSAACEEDGPFVYRADPMAEQHRLCDRWHPSIHMPKHAARIWLEITSVRVERLHNITNDDAKAEGCFFTDYGGTQYVDGTYRANPGWMWDKTTDSKQCLTSPRWAFANLWEKVNGEFSWDANPWVWVLEFKRIPAPTTDTD